jgi:hypothetical protein
MERYSDHFATANQGNQDVAGFVYDLHRKPGKSNESDNEQNLYGPFHRSDDRQAGRAFNDCLFVCDGEKPSNLDVSHAPKRFIDTGLQPGARSCSVSKLFQQFNPSARSR